MRALSGAELLDLWESGRDLHPLDQALLAIRAARPDNAASSADWPLGRRNRALIDLHRRSFGPALQGWTTCPDCGERMEFGIDAGKLIGSDPGPGDPTHTIRFKRRRFRLPTSRDLAESVQQPPDAAATRLLERCRTDEGEPVSWTDADLETIGERMAEADPLSEIRIFLACPECGHGAEETLDIAAFLWAEIEAGARRSVQEVHELASAYGWPEPAILSMSPARRALYLETVRR